MAGDRRPAARDAYPQPIMLPRAVCAALPHMELDVARVVFLIRKLNEEDPTRMEHFAKQLEALLLKTERARYETYILDEYPLTSLADAADALVREIARYAVGIKKVHVILIGQGTGGLVAAEAVQALRPPKIHPHPGDWRAKIALDGVITINTPLFMFADNVWSAAELAAMGLFAGRLIQSRKPDDKGLARKFSNSTLARFVTQKVISPSMQLGVGMGAAALGAFGADASWNDRIRFFAPIIETSFADRVERLLSILDRQVPFVSLLTRIKGGNPETYCHVPPNKHLPEELHSYHQFVDVKGGRARTVAENALDEFKQPEAFNGLVNQCATVIDGWAVTAADPDSTAAAVASE
ncbi:hypothetical protein H9P43_002709 [Blastocladiella emersonii ATCC 22665]|nr:hypothetical protein H9P43_002709 [Blastocladiella emersonii ATCC 22665]